VRFTEVNEHFWNLQATNYFVVNIHCWMKIYIIIIIIIIIYKNDKYKFDIYK